jgi:uncharacterized protein (DUF1684 family)
VVDHSREIPVTSIAPGARTAVPVICTVSHAGKDGVDPNHHLWRNGRLWWIAFTVHRGHLQERVRFSLKTDDVAEARRRRDRALSLYATAADCQISLRFAPRRTAEARS